MRLRLAMQTGIVRCVIAVLACVLCEVFIFNLAFWNSQHYQPIDSTVEIGAGLKQTGDFTYTVTDPNTATMTFPNIDTHVDNVYIPLSDVTKGRSQMADPTVPSTQTVSTGTSNSLLSIRIETNDAGHTAAKLLPETSLNGNVPQSHWITMRLAGNSTVFSIHVTSPQGTTLHLTGNPQLNVRRPFIVNPIRIVAYLMIVIGALVAPRIRRNWISATDRETRAYWFAAGTLGVILVAAVTLVTRPWESLRTSTWPPDYEYQWIARSIISGHTWLDYPVSDTLQNMANPYDTDARNAAHRLSGESFLVDFAYFNGHYYSYFGVLPCVLFFVPHLLVTGSDLAPWKVVLVLGMVLAVLMVMLVRLLFARWGKDMPIVLQSLVALAAVCAVQPTMYLSFMSTIYAVPIVSGLVFVVGAVCLWLKASMMRPGWAYWTLIAVGGVLIGLTIGCRPPMCIAIFLAPIILYRPIIRQGSQAHGGGDLRSGRESWQSMAGAWISNALAVGIPALFSTFPFLWWNKVRFGSFTEFGAVYQLTGHDMRVTAGGIARFPYAIWQGLLSPASVQESFPFLKVVSNVAYFAGDYQGFYGVEPRAGGMFFWAPFTLLFFALLAKRIRRSIDGDAGVLAAVAIVMGVASLLIDISVATLTTRYLCDFGYLFAIGGVLGLIAWSRTAESDAGERRIVHGFGASLSVLTVLLAIGSVFMMGRYSQLMDTNPEVFTMMRLAFSVFG